MYELSEQSGTLTLNSSNKAISAYQTNSQRNLSPYMILLELYKAMLKNIGVAKIAYRNKDLGKMFTYNQKNYLIISALQSHLDKQDGTKISVDLDKFYTALFRALVQVLNAPSPLDEFDRIEKSIQDVYNFWIKVGNVGANQISENSSDDTPQILDKPVKTGIDIA